jgi:hypothetical protein
MWWGDYAEGSAMPRGVYLLGEGLALVALALALTDWALSLRPGVTEANVKRIRKGMTLAEAEALLGGPAQRAGRDRCGGAWERVWAAPCGQVYLTSGLAPPVCPGRRPGAAGGLPGLAGPRVFAGFAAAGHRNEPQDTVTEASVVGCQIHYRPASFGQPEQPPRPKER